MPFQPGNSEASKRGKERRFKAALTRYADADPKRLDELAEKLWGQALTGDVPAMREIADRLDGKVPQALVGDDDEPALRLQLIERRIVKADDPDSGGLPPAA